LHEVTKARTISEIKTFPLLMQNDNNDEERMLGEVLPEEDDEMVVNFG
jgi:hypothetical protein